MLEDKNVARILVHTKLTQEAVKDRNTVKSLQSALVGNLPLLVKVTILRMVPRLENICQTEKKKKVQKFRIWLYCKSCNIKMLSSTVHNTDLIENLDCYRVPQLVNHCSYDITFPNTFSNSCGNCCLLSICWVGTVEVSTSCNYFRCLETAKIEL